MVVATALKARNFKDVIFVSDSILEPKAGATVSYLDRKGKTGWDRKGVCLSSLCGQV